MVRCARGEQGPESDLDIAFELTPEAIACEVNPWVAWMRVSEVWGGELERRVDMKTDLHFLHPEYEPTTRAAVAKEGKLICRRGV